MVLELEKANGSLQEQCQNQDKISVNLDKQVDHLPSIKQTLSSEKKNAEKKKQNIGLLKLCAIIYKQIKPRIMLQD